LIGTSVPLRALHRFSKILAVKSGPAGPGDLACFLKIGVSFMAKEQKVEFRKLLQHRIRLLREAADFSRKDMATMLDVFEDTYKKWEIGGTGTMPSYYYVKFCTMVKADLVDFLTPIPDEDEQIALYAIDTHLQAGNSHAKEFEDPNSGEISG